MNVTRIYRHIGIASSTRFWCEMYQDAMKRPCARTRSVPISGDQGIELWEAPHVPFGQALWCRHVSRSPLVPRSLRGGPRDCAQIVGEQAEADPAVHARVAVVPTAVQFVAAFAPADAALDPGPPVVSGDKPVLPLIRQPLGRLFPWFGQDDLGHLALRQSALVCRRLEAAVARHQLGRVAKALAVGVHARHHLGGFVRIPREDLRAGDDATLDLVQPAHAPELDWLARLAFAQDGRMRLEQADDLLGCGHLLALQHATRHVLDHLRDQRHQFLQPVGATLRRLVGRRRQGLRRVLRVIDHRLGQVHHVPLRRLQRIGSRLAFLACHVHDALHARLGLFGGFLQVLLTPADPVRRDLPRLAHDAAEHAHLVIEQGAIARMVDVSFYDRAINAQLPPVRHRELAGQHGDVVKQGLHGRRLDQRGPAIRVVSSGTCSAEMRQV